MAQHLILHSNAALAAVVFLLVALWASVAYVTYSLSQAVDAINNRPHSKALRLQGKASSAKESPATPDSNKK